MKKITRYATVVGLSLAMAFSVGVVPQLGSQSVVEAATKKPKLAKKSVTMTVKTKKKIKVKNIKKVLSAKTTKKTVAKVKKKGKAVLVTAKKPGKATIKVKVKDLKGKTKSLKLKVNVVKKAAPQPAPVVTPIPTPTPTPIVQPQNDKLRMDQTVYSFNGDGGDAIVRFYDVKGRNTEEDFTLTYGENNWDFPIYDIEYNDAEQCYEIAVDYLPMDENENYDVTLTDTVSKQSVKFTFTHNYNKYLGTENFDAYETKDSQVTVCPGSYKDSTVTITIVDDPSLSEDELMKYQTVDNETNNVVSYSRKYAGSGKMEYTFSWPVDANTEDDAHSFGNIYITNEKNLDHLHIIFSDL